MSVLEFHRGANLALWRCMQRHPNHCCASENAAPEAYDLRGVANAYFRAGTWRGTGPHHLWLLTWDSVSLVPRLPLLRAHTNFMRMQKSHTVRAEEGEPGNEARTLSSFWGTP